MELPRRRLVVVAGLALAVITALSGPVAAGEVGAKVGTSPVPRVSAPVFGESGPNALPPPKNLDYLLRVAPIPGLTTIWHVMPHVTDVPVGTVVRLHLAIPPGVDVTWTGAFELGRDAWGVDALCPLIEVGDALIEASYHHPFFGPTTWTCDITVINIQPSDIDVGVTLSAESMEIDESLPENELNDLTMAYYFNERSYAALRDLGGGQYRTSTSRMVTLNADVDPPGIAPLIEWRLNGVAKARGTAWYQLTDEVGIDAIDVGPTAAPASVQLETYRVSITPAQDVVIDGEPSVYFAQTTPPGYESDVTWLSSTKYGSATPIISEGPMLTVLFENTWSPGNTEQWLGVKADNEVTGQDGTKCCLPFSEADLLAFWEDPIANPLPDVCIDLPCADCMLLGGTCFTGDCPLVTQTVERMVDDEMGARHETCSALNCDPRAAPGCGCGSLIDALFTGAIPCAGGAGSFEDFADNPIPADFFGPGSDPFTELVCLKGEPLGNTVFGVFDTADTLILRSDNPFECDAPFPDIGVVDIEIVELHLVSIDPIVVTFNGGQTPELWDVEVELSDLDQPIGSMTVQKTHDNGGTFTADLPVLPKITFTQVANPGNIQVLDFGLAGLDPIGFTTQPTGWVHEVKLGTVKPEGGPSCFNPSIAEP